MTYSPFAMPLFLAAGAVALLAGYSWRHRTAHPAAPTFVAVVVCIVIWLAAYGLEIESTSLAGKELWETVIIVSLAWLPFFWLVFAIQYTGQEAWLTGRAVVWLLLPPIVTTLVTVSNGWHHLMWTAITLDGSGPFLATIPQRGPWFWVHAPLSYGYILFGMGLFILFSRTATLFRRQGLIILMSSAIPLIGNALHLAGAIPVPGLDPGAFAFALSAGLMALGLFRYQMLDVVPVAQRVVLDHLHDGVIVLDPQGRIVDQNPAARRLLSPGGGEWVGRLAREVVGLPEVVALCEAPVEARAELLVTGDEGQRWLQASALPFLTERGRAGGRIVIVHDVTREHTAEQLRQDLTHVTVHDLRNPLSIVSAALELLTDYASETMDASLLRCLQLGQESCRQATELVTSLLQVSQLESGQMPLYRQRVDVAELVRDVGQAMGLVAVEGQLTLSIELAADDLPPVAGDAALLRRVLENLVGNAIKFTPPGGTVTVAATVDGDRLHLVVADTGPGLPPEMEGRLFQKFCTGYEGLRGSGLGLAFCKLAVEAHGGQIWIDSRPGQGTQAHVMIPLGADTKQEHR